MNRGYCFLFGLCESAGREKLKKTKGRKEEKKSRKK